MNTLLTQLRVPEAIQVFFNTGELLFPYGDNYEHFDTGFHRVPTTRNLWLAGKELTREVIITSTAMEAIAYYTVAQHRYSDLESLSFIALGNLPHPAQLNWIKTNYHKRKFTLVFGKDLLGRLADIKVAAGLNGRELRLLNMDPQVQIHYDERTMSFFSGELSLNAFEKTAGIRTGIRTAKPKDFDTFLDQLKHDAKQ